MCSKSRETCNGVEISARCGFAQESSTRFGAPMKLFVKGDKSTPFNDGIAITASPNAR